MICYCHFSYISSYIFLSVNISLEYTWNLRYIEEYWMKENLSKNSAVMNKNLNFVYLLRLWWGNLNLEFGALVCNFYTIYNYTTSFIPFSTQKRSWIDINYQYYMCDCKDVRIHSVITLNLCRTLRVIILSLRTVLLFMRLCGSRYIWTKIIMRETKKYRTLGDLWTILQARCPKGRIRFQWVLNWEKRNRKWFASTMFLCAFLGVCSDFLPVAPAIVFRASLSNELFQSRWYM